MRLLNPRIHGVIDYLYVPILLLSPSVFGFGGVAATICYVLAVAHGLMSLLTNYPLGIAKMIPFPVHGAVEVVATIFLFASPWLFGFSGDIVARNFFVANGVLLGLVWLTTDYRSEIAAREPLPAGTSRRYA